MTDHLRKLRWYYGLFSCIALSLLAMSALQEKTVAQPDALASLLEDREFLGNNVCTSCHTVSGEQWAHTVHDVAFGGGTVGQWGEQAGCESCHGPGSAHVQNPAEADRIIRFTFGSPTQVSTQNQVCMGCHQGEERIHWFASAHERNEVACADCHNPMAEFSVDGLLSRESVNQTCFGCHQTERAEFNRRSHMPLSEGQLSCNDCHSPHGSITEPLLKATSVNETCYQCHAEKRGPYLFEHAPVRESCVNCHTPHGSNHDKLLLTARPLLCQQCHVMVGHINDLLARNSLPSGARPDTRLAARSCQNCHAQIHGSNHPAGAKFQR